MAATRADDDPFIGRAAELGRLHASLTTTTSGRPAIVVIGGESGVGKTRLVTEFLTQARAQGATGLVGGCTDFGESGPSYWAVLEALRPVWAQAGVPDPASDVPGGPVAPVSPGRSDEPAPGPKPLFELILRVLRRVAEEAPVVLVVEDVHWADRSTRDLVAFLLANLHQDRVMIVVTFRSEAMGRRHSIQPMFAELRRSRRAEFLELRPFTKEEVAAKIHGMLGRPPDDELVDMTWSRCDGNPFFAEELVAAVLDGYGSEPPPTLRHILTSRVDVLSEAARRVVRLVAVAGDGVTYPLLAAVAETDEGELVAALRECVDRQLVAVQPDGRTYRFRHSLMQEVLYDELLPGEKHLFHAAYGRALERQLGRPDSMGAAKLAYHWYAAGDPERAIVAAVDAASTAAAIFGFAEAQRHYERAIELWDMVANPSGLLGLERSDLFERAAEVADLAGEHRRASALIGAAVAELETESARPTQPGPAVAPNGARRADLLQRLGHYLWAAGDSREALRAYQEAVRSLPPGVVSPARASVEGAYAEALMLSGRYRASQKHAEAALKVAREAGAQLQETQILATLGFDLAFLGDSASGVSALERAQLLAEELGHPDDIGRAYLNRAKLLSGPLNCFAEAAQVAEQGMVRVRQLGLERTYGVALQAIAVNTLFRLGRWAEADGILHQAMAAKPTGTAAIDLCLARAKLCVGRGDVAGAEADFQAVESMAAGELGPHYEAPLLTLRAGLDLWLGRPDQARDAVKRGIMASVSGSDDVWLLAPLIWHGLRAEADLAARARVRRETEELETATTIASGLWAQMQSLAAETRDAAPSITQAIGAYLRLCEGEAARAEGTTAPDAWADAARRWLDLHQPYPAAYANWREAEALLSLRSRSARAVAALRAAHAVAVRLGAAPFRSEVESLAGRARISLDEGSPRGARLERRPSYSGTGPGWAGHEDTPAPGVAARPLPGIPAPSAEGHSPAATFGHATPRSQASPATPVGAPDGARDGALRDAKTRYSLTDREFEVWLLLPEGVTNHQIGERLFISGKTASVHVTNILRKLGLKSRVQAIALAHQLGLVGPQLPSPKAPSHQPPTPH